MVHITTLSLTEILYEEKENLPFTVTSLPKKRKYIHSQLCLDYIYFVGCVTYEDQQHIIIVNPLLLTFSVKVSWIVLYLRIELGKYVH